MAAKYAKKKSSKHGFILKKGEIEPYKAKIARSTIERLFASEKVIDLAIRHEDRGGSVDELRIWVLVGDKQFPAHRGAEAVRQTGNRQLPARSPRFMNG